VESIPTLHSYFRIFARAAYASLNPMTTKTLCSVQTVCHRFNINACSILCRGYGIRFSRNTAKII